MPVEETNPNERGDDVRNLARDLIILCEPVRDHGIFGLCMTKVFNSVNDSDNK
jgi:hypothetical protein